MKFYYNDVFSKYEQVLRCLRLSSYLLKKFLKEIFNFVCALFSVQKQPPELFYKKDVLILWHRCFPVNFAKFLRTPFLTEHIRWLLLSADMIEYRMENNVNKQTISLQIF